MSKVVDMTGQRYGMLTIINRGPNDKHNKAQWWCQCDCGSPLKLINGAAIRRGLVVSCGCNKRNKLKQYNESNVVDETGNIYGYLTVIRRVEDNETTSRDGRAQWLCRCKCGNEVITTGKLLRDGHKISCGCAIRSRGALAINALLLQNQISFTEQYTVYITQNLYEIEQKHPYYFDFAIINDNKQVLYLIEFDGEQHFHYKENSDFWNNKEKFKLTQLRDQLKNQWCKDNNIPLIRIPYTQLDKLSIEDLQLETTQFRV